jgi:WW domain-binding protein 4
VPRPSDPYTNYSTAQSLGYTDPDAEFLKAEAERRRTQGVAGEWELVTAATAPRIMPNSEDAVGMKRMREVEDEDRSWKLRKKTLGVGLGDIYDPGIIATTPRATQEERVSMPDGISGVPDKLPETTDETSKKSKWKTLDDEDSSSPRTVPMPVAEEGTDSEKQDFPRAPRTSEPPSRDEEPRNVAAQSDSLLTNLPPASLFRKRKAASGGGSRGKRP